MGKILIVDDVAMLRRPVALALRAAGHETTEAANGADALAMIQAAVPDLILLDLSMPRMSGMEVLRQLRTNTETLRLPVILLTATAGKDHVVEAAQLGVRDYVLKTGFSVSELLSRVHKYVSPVSTGQLQAAATYSAKPVDADAKNTIVRDRPGTVTLGKDKCIKRIELAMQGRTLSGVVANVMATATSPRSDVAELAKLIQHDSMLSARILQAANSAAFVSRRGSVTTIIEAVRNIGATNVRNIAASVGIFDAMPVSSPDGFNPIRCWQHSFAVARLCEAFTLPSAPAEAGIAYLVGLCHDLGEIMFRTEFEKEYQSVLNLQEQPGASLNDIERQLFGMTRDEILKVILKCIGLPECIRSPIERFQKTSKLSADQPAVLRALGMAETYANGLLLASSEASLISPFTERQWATLAGSSKLQVPDGEEIRSQVFCLSAILSRMNSTDQAKLHELPGKKNEAPIWLARDSSFAIADPLAEALKLLGNVDVKDHLPTGQELAGHSAVVVENSGKTMVGWETQDVETCRNFGNVQLPLLWITSDPKEEIGDGDSAPLRTISIQSLQMFVNGAMVVTDRAAA